MDDERVEGTEPPNPIRQNHTHTNILLISHHFQSLAWELQPVCVYVM